MSAGKKLGSVAEPRAVSPLIAWIRDKLLAVGRRPGTGVPGIPGPDGKNYYQEPGRWADTQSARGGYNPQIPGGVHHKLAENYYYERDGRREVLPPLPVYETKDDGSSEFRALTGEKVEPTQILQTVNKGPNENFGLPAPTPGFGCEWKRSRDQEELTQRYDPQLQILERYDKYTAVKPSQ